MTCPRAHEGAAEPGTQAWAPPACGLDEGVLWLALLGFFAAGILKLWLAVSSSHESVR